MAHILNEFHIVLAQQFSQPKLSPEAPLYSSVS